ncbi:tRNA-dihydrouridine(47) synthase [NAD(P)(+)]-like isoform X2 [Pocillopora damicornis]|uniref:tRNA-dihydrouridine(47) synthase [NAD(P)(+)]-like isoform X2 n=1 Tax=Pocillopora damicornis TaxID=46731 RepID=UPI000F55345A|nr:tRNA-dihydrouridine(47) synthase [NAD(P)(+)]-like isoform X2 [Pocillopora damicornis]
MADDGGKGFSPSETTNGGDNSQSDTLVETKLDLESVSLVPGVKLRPGVAPIKTQYLKKVSKSAANKVSSDESKASCNEAEKKRPVCEDESDNNKAGEPSKKKKKRGMNKARPRAAKLDFSQQLCTSVVKGELCAYGENCRYLHDIEKYVTDHKLPDIGETCVNFEKYGKCIYGITCRYGKKHISQNYENIVNEELYKETAPSMTRTVLSKELTFSLRKKQYEFPKADTFLAQLAKVKAEGKEYSELGSLQRPCPKSTGAITDEDVIKLRPQEKKKINFADKLYLAPLTTVGNLPFRRVCKQFGADITCSEMAMCTKLLQGSMSEWALLKRHSSEDIFGAQLCGSFPDSMAKSAELLQNDVPVDFVDINIGCPIDLVFKQGAGSALMGRMGKFEQIVRGMNYVMDIPLTVKMRTGISDKKTSWNAHKLISNLKTWGVSLATLHGRSREQRYTRLADWEYISECAKAAAPMPLFGNGDILSHEDAVLRREQTGVSGLMIARGALIKPWIFTEIKENRHWDISSNERFDMLRDFANFGLEHWGSDTMGVENTRRFLLEWLSFQCREMLIGPVPSGFCFIPKHKSNSYTETEG